MSGPLGGGGFGLTLYYRLLTATDTLKMHKNKTHDNFLHFHVEMAAGAFWGYFGCKFFTLWTKQ